MNRVMKHYQISYLHRMGWTGKGIGVAVLDTGISPHIDFQNRVVTFCDVLEGKKEPYDDNGHGTHVAGIIAGCGLGSGGRYCGVAPDAHLIIVKVLNATGNGNVQNVIRGIDWIINNKEKYKIRIANISIGSVSEMQNKKESAMIEAVERLWDAGIVVLGAAGNNGPDRGTITVPGVSSKIITVGTVDDSKVAWIFGRQKSNYSGRGPTAQCIMKPEILALGNDIISCNGVGYGYTKKSGTSMSTPIVAGAVALLLQKEPNLTPKQVKMHLKTCARNLGMPQNKQGWGEIDMVQLLRIQ